MSSIDGLAMSAVMMQQAQSQQGLSIAMIKQQLDVQKQTVETLVTVATEAAKGQVVNMTA